MKLTRHGHRLSLLEAGDQNEALEASDTLLAEVDEKIEAESSPTISGPGGPDLILAVERSKGHPCVSTTTSA